MTIIVKYSCFLCGLRRIPLEVPARSEEDVKQWMAGTVWRIGGDHATRSPRCQAVTISEIMIPTPEGTQKIGGPVTN